MSWRCTCHKYRQVIYHTIKRGTVAVAWHRNVFDGIDDTYNILNYNIWRRYDLPRTLDDDVVTMLHPMPGSTKKKPGSLLVHHHH